MTELWHILLQTARQAVAMYKPQHVPGDTQQGMHMRPGLHVCIRENQHHPWRAQKCLMAGRPHSVAGRGCWRPGQQLLHVPQARRTGDACGISDRAGPTARVATHLRLHK